jgi:hypothetical protein
MLRGVLIAKCAVGHLVGEIGQLRAHRSLVAGEKLGFVQDTRLSELVPHEGNTLIERLGSSSKTLHQRSHIAQLQQHVDQYHFAIKACVGVVSASQLHSIFIV